MKKTKIEEKKHLSARGLLGDVRKVFSKVKDPESGKGSGNGKISLVDCLMSGLAIFGLKYPSLLQFDKHKNSKTIKSNIKSLYQIINPPCDTYLRERLDVVDPRQIRRAFTDVFSEIQRGKALESYQLVEGYYVLLTDGSGFFSSNEIHCKNCCQKHHKDGTTTFYHMMMGAAIVHPDHKVVIPICPEPVMNEDGNKKNDCERNASKRLLEDFRREHPHLKVILAEDGLASNAPHLRLCQELNIRFITVVKPGGNKKLFEWLKGIELDENEICNKEGNCIHRIRYYNSIPLNEADPDLEVNYVEYWEYDSTGRQKYHNTWVTDLELKKENVYEIVRGGRARWKIENETFNTLKNQGYNFEHNYGHGEKNLSTVFAMLMMLAFLIDQAQQLYCPLFQAAWEKLGSKKSLWEHVRAAFIMFYVKSWKSLYEGLIYGLVGNDFIPDTS